MNRPYSLLRNTIFIFAILLTSAKSIAQQHADTIVIDSKNVNTSVLKQSTNRYLVYFKMGADSARSRPQFWTRNIEFADYNGKEAIVITQEWEDRDTIAHTVKSICDKQTFAPLYHKSWWKTRPTGEFDFMNKTASLGGVPLTDDDTARNRKGPWEAFKTACNQYELNWHLDLEVFPILPYQAGKTFLIPFYEPGWTAPQHEAYTVTGTDILEGYDSQKIDCWLLSHESRGYKETFWVSKKTKEVLKLEEEIGKNKWRYKIKLGFSL